ncbi:MAG: FAD-dependent oxidoreductase [Methanosarcinales archaeon]|nr:MAG: FAD-dependent oxidoreductase [Methanosarcinales archaeon]
MYDIIIAGGGPAGAVAAERAAQKGLSVLVLEKETYPRDKTCGGGVSQKALDAIGFGTKFTYTPYASAASHHP